MADEENSLGKQNALNRIVAASLVGSVLEWYDFFLYGFTAALVFGKVFFPIYSPLMAVLASFATLAVGFIARPLGGIIFGHLGDRAGRKAALVTTLVLMGGATFAIGLLPSYETIGVAAPILLVLLRILQGIGLGGEWGGAVLLTLEYAPVERRGFYGSLVQIGAGLGLSLATAVLLAGSMLSSDAFIDWGWRIPFISSILLLVIGLYIRTNITETPEFKAAIEKREIVRFPISEVLLRYPKQVLATAGLYLGGVTVPFYTVWVFLVYYATDKLHVDRTSILVSVAVVNLLLLIATISGGVVSDRIGRRMAFLFGSCVQAAVAFPFFWLVDLAQPMWIALAMILFGAPQWFCWGAMAATAAEQFPPEVRYTGISVGGQAATIIGGLVPLYSTALFPVAGTWPVSALVVGCSVLTLISILFTKENMKSSRSLHSLHHLANEGR